MSPHYTLTEPSLLTHRGKGREGKGREVGRESRVACDSIHRRLGDALAAHRRSEPNQRPTMDAPQSGGDR